MWFRELFGFNEPVGRRSWREDRADLLMQMQYCPDSGILRLANGKTFHAGRFEVVSVADLRAKARRALDGFDDRRDWMKVREVRADVAKLHVDRANEQAVFQVASQFNCLEMPGPDVTPDDGIDGYDCDMTQGPRCAIAAGAGTVVRNYFVPVGGHFGQTEDVQVDCFAGLGRRLTEECGLFYRMQNGYALLYKGPNLARVERFIVKCNDRAWEELSGLLKVGVMWDTEVTWNYPEAKGQLVNQVFCSALPLSYSKIVDVGQAEALCHLVLTAAYEAVLCVAILNMAKCGFVTQPVFLTHLGTGAFGNPKHWARRAGKEALDKYANAPLDVYGVSLPGKRI